MKKELSQKEREETVTKGFLSDYLNNKKYITESRLEEILDSKNYVTKSYLDQTIESTLKRYQKEDRAHLESLMEDYYGRIFALVELFEARFERIERKIGLA